MPEAARELIEVGGIVRESLPDALFRVELENEKRSVAVAHVAGGGGLLRLLPGDNVLVELHPYDMTRGRIVRKRI